MASFIKGLGDLLGGVAAGVKAGGKSIVREPVPTPQAKPVEAKPIEAKPVQNSAPSPQAGSGEASRPVAVVGADGSVSGKGVDPLPGRPSQSSGAPGASATPARNTAGSAQPNSGGLPPYLVNAVKGFEGFTPTASWDYKQHSVGYGTRGNPGETITREQADIRLNEELGKAQAMVNRFAPDAPDGVKAALTSLTFNAGSAWMTSGLGERVKAGDWGGAKDRFLQYNKAGGKVLPGLVKRRQAEAAWFDGAGSNDAVNAAVDTMSPSRPQSASALDQAARIPGAASADAPGEVGSTSKGKGILDGLAGALSGLGGGDGGEATPAVVQPVYTQVNPTEPTSVGAPQFVNSERWNALGGVLEGMA